MKLPSIILLISSLNSFAFIQSVDENWLNVFSNHKTHLKTIYFAGLRFKIDPTKTSCKNNQESMTCILFTKDNLGSVNEMAQMVFEKKAITSEASLGLIRLNRKHQWLKFPMKNQYLLDQIKIDGSERPLQRVIVFQYDNINWPVLLRAFDVVVNQRTNVSIMTKCNEYYWPLIKEVINNIELSISKSPQ